MPETLYSTSDGSVWVESRQEPGHFTRVSGKGADMDFRAQKLVEVLKVFGPLSIHDPTALLRNLFALMRASRAAGWTGVNITQANIFVNQLKRNGYKIVMVDE